MAEMARSNRYARRLSLFYNVFIPYRLDSDGPIGPADSHVPGDRVVFNGRSERHEKRTRDTIRPLIEADNHEMHLHVHHEFWTRNTSHFDHPVSRWVNACSTSEADGQRLDLLFKLSKEAIAREIGRPFEHWAFIHGNWALNASDPLICHVSDEMSIIMRHGGFGDFSFPAGRGYCDPKLERPFTCKPIDQVRAYDDPRSDPRPVDARSRVMNPSRFFIWNSPIKATHSSLDYYSAANRTLFKTPERIVETWLSKSVCLGKNLFIKTHAHSMKSDYQLAQGDGCIPHCHPDIIAIFDCLARACDRARIELKFLTVNEVMQHLHVLDSGQPEVLSAARVVTAPPLEVDGPSARHPEALKVADGAASSEAALPPTSLHAVSVELAAMHRAWMKGEGAHFPVDDLYRTKLSAHAPLEPYEFAVAAAICERYPASATRIVEIGSGWGGLAILLARLGFEVFAFEGNIRRHTACQWHFDQQRQRYPALQESLVLAPAGLFPATFPSTALAEDKINVGICTNITSSYSAENYRAIAHAAASFDELILDLARFGEARNDQSDRDSLFEVLRTTDFRPVEQLYFSAPYEYWRFRSRAVGTRSALPVPVAAEPPDAVVGANRSDRIPTVQFGPIGSGGRLFSMAGDQQLTTCPVCNSKHIEPLWRMPATTLPEPIQVFGGYFDQIPTLQVPATLYGFDFCNGCESIFLNPVPSRQKEGYRKTDHYIRKMQTAAEWKGYEDAYDRFARWIPAEATVMVDAACGVGQYLEVTRQRKTHRWRRLVGLELAEKYVAHMRDQGLEAHVFDVDSDDILAILDADSVDFISFCEAFEHVERPLDALRKLLTVLRPGGRLFFTAQRYGEDVQAAVRPGEPIYIGTKVVNDLPRHLGCRIVNMTTSRMRYYIVLEK
ncbi:class I SAM-dependent methyltransferase [uncultured Reyranella sp.]|uniref:methyltransferase domain-containing protein n=1 Tax=uncultured Reyranella sp. TaxID=735512 RepID=UPI0025FFCE4A|nr:class I SAM-dependent methyltransferase [uncultured Reyranella sp.]